MFYHTPASLLLLAQGLPNDQPAVGQQLLGVDIRHQHGDVHTEAVHPRTEGGNLSQPWAKVGRGRQSNMAVEVFQLIEE